MNNGGRVSRSSATLLAAAIVALFLFTPKREIGDCIKIWPIMFGAHIAHNCDSRLIAKEALDFQRYLTIDSTPWRTRPVYIFAVGSITHILAPVVLPITMALKGHATGSFRGIRGYLNAYVGGIVFNMLVLALAVLTAWRLLEVHETVLSLGLVGVLASSDIAAGWIWVPHSIIVNLLVPLGVMASFLLGMTLKLLTHRQTFLLGSATALACLTYGYCLIWPIAFVLGAGYSLIRFHHWTRIKTFAAGIAVFCLAVIVPLILWFGAYYLQGSEVAYEAQGAGQFTWPIQAAGEGRLGEELVSHFFAQVHALSNHLGLFGAMLTLISAALMIIANWRIGWRGVWLDPVVTAAFLGAVLMLVFNYLQGYYQPRLQVCLLLIAVILSTRLLLLIGWRSGAAGYVWAVTGLQLIMAVSAPAVSQT